MMKKFILLALSQLFALCVLADGFPRYYELVQETSQLESGKYYIIAAVPDNLESLTNRIAYNGINTNNHYGNADRVSVPATYIIDIGSTEKHAVPLKFIQNGEKWNLYDETATEGSQLIGVNTSTSGDNQHYLLADANTESDKTWNLWHIEVDSRIATIKIQKSNNIYYLRYDTNSYDDPTSFFRVYSLTDNKLRVMLYKEMETVTATTSFTGHGTLYYSDKVLMVPEGVTAKTYTLGENKDKVNSHVAYGPGSFIPANSAVVLYGATTTYPLTTTYTFPVTNRHNPDRDDKNILLGLDNGGETTTGKGATEDAKYYFYKLTTKNNVAETVGFYWAVNEGKAFTSAAHKAYLAVEKDVAANIRSFLLDFSETTSISNVSLPTPEETKWVYDLSGRRFSTSQSLPKGIYISNGKKFVVK
jgi:hypothetical protein